MKAREVILNRVKELYKSPPRLASRFPSATQIPLEQCLNHTTQHLKDWLVHIEHHKKMASLIAAIRPQGQITIQQAFCNVINRHSGEAKYPS
jgi:hypothetical protein